MGGVCVDMPICAVRQSPALKLSTVHPVYDPGEMAEPIVGSHCA